MRCVEPVNVRIQRFSLIRWAVLGWARVLALAVIACCVGATFSAMHVLGDLMLVLSVLAGVAVMIAVVAAVPLAFFVAFQALSALTTAPRRGSIEVEDGRLNVLAGYASVYYPCTDVRAVVAREPESALFLMEDGDRLHVTTRTEAHLDALLEAIVTPHPGNVWAVSQHREAPSNAWLWMFLGSAGVFGLTAAGATGIEALWPASIGAVALAIWIAVLRSRDPLGVLWIGTDGVAIRDPYSRFVPFDDVVHVASSSHGATLLLKNDVTVELRVTPPDRLRTGAAPFAARRQVALLQRIEEGRAHLGASLVGEERLLRNGRSLDAWRAGVQDLVRRDVPGYRIALLPVDEAARVIEAPRVAAEARIGAALALSTSTDEALKKRLRIAVKSLADETTRLAVLEALDDRLDPFRLEELEPARRMLR